MQNKQDLRKIRIIVAAIVIAVGAAMAVYSFMTLPAAVSTQFEGFLNTGAPKVPKLVAVILPFAIVILFAYKSVSQPRSIFLCLIGYVTNILFWLCN